MIQMAHKPNTTHIGEDRETLALKALLYFNEDIHAQVCRLFCVCISHCSAWFSLVTPAITNIFVVNQIIRYN